MKKTFMTALAIVLLTTSVNVIAQARQPVTRIPVDPARPAPPDEGRWLVEEYGCISTLDGNVVCIQCYELADPGLSFCREKVYPGDSHEPVP